MVFSVSKIILVYDLLLNIGQDGSSSITPETSNDDTNFECLSPGSSVNLVTRNLTKYFKNSEKKKFAALDRVTLDLCEGQVFVILGPNSAGKSTLLKCLSGLYSINEGSVHIYNLSIKEELDKIRQIIGVCNQNDILFDYLTAYEHLNLYAQLKVFL